jgi:hypothetical protein
VIWIFLPLGQKIFPLDPRAKKPFVALFLKVTSSQFSLSMAIFIQK